MDINELLKDVKSFNKEAAMKENMRMLALKDSIVADAFNEANVKLASYFGGIKLDSPESNLTEFSRNKLSGKMKAILSVSTTAGLKRLPIHFVVKASVPYMVETPEQVVAALENVEGSLDKEVREILEKQKGLTDYHNEDIEVKADGEKTPSVQYRDFHTGRHHLALFNTREEALEAVKLLKQIQDTEYPEGQEGEDDYNMDMYEAFATSIGDIEVDYRTVQNDPEYDIVNKDWVIDASAKNSTITVQAKKKEINLVNRENTAASQFPVKLLVYPKTYLPELKKGDVVNVGGFKYKYIGDEPLLSGDTENGINARFELMRTDKKASLNKKADSNLKQIWFKKNGHSIWEEYGPIRDITSFNKDFYDWILECDNSGDDVVSGVKNWNEALDVLNTVGASTLAGWFTIEDIGFNPNGDSENLSEDDFVDPWDYIYKGGSNFGKESISKTHLNKKAADDKKENKSKKSEEDEDKEQRDKDFKDKLKFMQEEKHFEDLDPSQLMAMVTTYRYYHMRLPKEALDAISQSADSASRYMSSFDSLEEAFEEATPKIIERVVSSPKYLVGVLKNYSDDINFDILPKQVKDKLMGDVVALVDVVKAAPSLLTEEVAEKIIKESPTEAETIYSTFGTVEEKGNGWDKIKEWAEEKKLDQAPTNEEIGIAQDDQPYKPNVKNDKSVDDDYTAMGTEEDSEPYNPSNKEEILGPNKNDLQVEDEEDKKANVDSSFKKEAEATDFSTDLSKIKLDISSKYISNILKEQGITVGQEDTYYAINSVESDGELKWKFDFSGGKDGIEYFQINVPDQTIPVKVEYYTAEEYNNENGGEPSTVDIQLPLSNVEVVTHTMNTLDGMTLYPESLEVNDNGGVEVSF